MELDKLGRQLQFMLLLTQNCTLSVDDIGRKLQMSKRTIYRYLDAFSQQGFIVEKTGTKYRLDYRSPYFRKLVQGMQFSEDEALTLYQVLNSVYDNSLQVRNLRNKLAHIYNPEVLAKHYSDERYAENIRTLYECIREQRLAILHNYESPSSGTVADRIVEPYMFLNENSEVRCYEISSGQNKTFKIGRMESVEPIDLLWSHKEDHAPVFTDLFHFSGEERIEVHLVLGRLATNMLLEEYPGARPFLTAMPKDLHRLDIEVCSLKGVGRFVLGLFDDIRVVRSPELTDYLRERAAALQEKLK